MTRALEVVPAEPMRVLAALRASLSGDGPAVLVGEPGDTLPAEVPRRVALVVETSGSTGRPKRVALSSDALLSSTAASASALGGEGQWLLALPVHYIAGLNVLVRSIASQVEPVVLAPGSFTADSFVDAATHLGGDLRFTSLVPAQLATLLETDVALSALRSFDRILVGGQATPPALLARAKEEGLSITRTYGSSETCGGCVYDGRPIGGAEVRSVGGRIELSGPMLAEGYLDDDERTNASFIAEHGRRWYRTDDLGDVVDGIVRVTGRIDDVIVSGGVKVSLGEVERAVRALPGQEQAVVVAAASPRWGQVPVVVTIRPLQLDEVRRHVGAHLGSAAAPARVVVVERMPLLSTGKPDLLTIRSLAQ